MANRNLPDVDLGTKREAETGYEVNDPEIALPVYRGSGPPVPRPPKKKKDMPARSPKAEAMRRRIDLATKDE